MIHLSNLKSNLSILRGLSPGSFFCPMVKANAYGHGDQVISKILEANGVQVLGVGLIEEGILLRQAGVTCQILFFGIFDRPGVKAILETKLTPVCSVWEQIHILEELDVDRPTEIHLKVDTGMHRLGFSLDEVAKVIPYLENHPKIRISGYLTHFHSGEDLLSHDSRSFSQLIAFEESTKYFKKVPTVHSLNSAGLLNLQTHQDLKKSLKFAHGSRPGLALYGVNPLQSLPSHFSADSLGLRSVMSLRSEVVRVFRLKANEGVSYSWTWTSKRPSIVGVIPCGYADGYHRKLSNRGEILFRGKKVPVIGNVCMDYFMVDLTEALNDQEMDSAVGEEVTLFGYDSKGNYLSPQELALAADTIAWEILTSVGERVPRTVVD